MPMSSATAASSGLRLNASKTGSRSCIAWPSLLSERCASPRRRPSRVERILLEEAADRLAARQEVPLGRVARAAIRGEDRRLVRRRHVLAREQERALAKLEASRRIREIGQHEEAVLPVCRLLFRRKVSAHDAPAPLRWRESSAAVQAVARLLSPASDASTAALSVFSQVNSGSSRPKWP